MQMNLTGFLYGNKARLFMKELWNHLSSAQENVSGIPTEFLEEKKEEIRQMKVYSHVVASVCMGISVLCSNILPIIVYFFKLAHVKY